jgi:hypothetical protein
VPDLAAPGAFGFALKVPKWVRIKKVLGLTSGACEQHSYLLFIPLDAFLLFEPPQLFCG